MDQTLADSFPEPHGDREVQQTILAARYMYPLMIFFATALMGAVPLGHIQGQGVDGSGNFRAAIAGSPKAPITHEVLEAYPYPLLASIERNHRAFSLSSTADGRQLESVFDESLKWPQGRTLRVAFLGGDVNLHKDIALASRDWTDHCNIRLDFGLNRDTETYRSWSTDDKVYQAEIRISFDRPGLWSLVGKESNNPAIGNKGEPDGGRPYQRSMNFSNFDKSRPKNWRAVVLHEFGHALGFQHEHQHPTSGCDKEFRWDDDQGYNMTTNEFDEFTVDEKGRLPGIYTVLGGPPNCWPKAMVDHNLRQLKESHAFKTTAFDKASIMKYWFRPWMFTSGEASDCFTATENTQLSPIDIQEVSRVYPKAAQNR